MTGRIGPNGQHAAPERGRLIQPARQAASVGRRSLEPRSYVSLLFHPPQRHVHSSTFQLAPRPCDQLQAVQFVIAKKQLQNERLLRREREHTRTATHDGYLTHM